MIKITNHLKLKIMSMIKNFMEENGYFEMTAEEQTKFTEDFEAGRLIKEIEAFTNRRGSVAKTF
jgi:hypothetical protein